MTDCKVFYSWQSDLSNSTNRGFIADALEKAVKSIHGDDSIEVEPVVDRDTSGVPGSPDIANTIFAKIDQASVFVCDISIINSGSKLRLTPNPNVLIELGYAIKALGSERIIMVMNTAFGAPERLPFDLRMRRVTTYHLPEGSTEKSTERKKLQKTLQAALNIIFTDQSLQLVGKITQPLSKGEQARIAIENNDANQKALTREFMKHLVEQLDSITPDFKREVTDEMIVDSIGQTIEIGVEFAHLAETIAVENSLTAAIALYKYFEVIISRYNTPPEFSGSFFPWAFDFYKFVGHEFFVTFFSFLIREKRWEIITEILDEDLDINNIKGMSSIVDVNFSYVAQYLQSLEHRNYRLNLKRISLHADLLHERHTQGSLAEIVPMQQFIDAECFLFLRAYLPIPEINSYPAWISGSLICMKQPPRYLIEAYKAKNAQKLLAPLKMDSIEMFKKRMTEVMPILTEAVKCHGLTPLLLRPLGDFDPQRIGSNI